jgi:signal transduction histidine kinase
MHLVSFIEQQSKRTQAIEALVMLAMLGTLDYVTGQGLSVSLLYSILVFIVAWFGERKFALIFATLCAVSWWWANMDVHPYGGRWGYAWATASRLASFIFVAVGSSALRSKQESDRQRIEALERAKALESEIARISEHEQRRIGQDLHDGICQVMAAIRCSASSVRDDLQAKGLPEAAASAEIADMLGAALIEIRQLARGIFPVQMEAAGLAAVLDELVETTRRLQRVPVFFETQGEVKVSSPEVAMHLYRIAQEALNNAIKHSGAKRISVALTEARGMLKMTVTDDGGGFDTRSDSKDGMGLNTMRYRAQLIGAELNISGGPGGVTVTCLLPIANIPAHPHLLSKS